MQELLDQQLQMQRIEVMLLGTLAGLALLLSAVGIYALVSNLVVQRTREIGIRIALGSTLGQAMRTIARSGLTAACAGVLVGLVGSAFALQVMKSAIYGVTTYDPVTLISAPALLLAIAGPDGEYPSRGNASGVQGFKECPKNAIICSNRCFSGECRLRETGT